MERWRVAQLAVEFALNRFTIRRHRRHRRRGMLTHSGSSLFMVQVDRIIEQTTSSRVLNSKA